MTKLFLTGSAALHKLSNLDVKNYFSGRQTSTKKSFNLFSLSKWFIFFVFFVQVSLSLAAERSARDLMKSGEVRLEGNQQAQAAIDKISDATQVTIEEYHQRLKVVEDLSVYNELLSRQINDQHAEIQKRQKSIVDAAIIERQILPMLVRMTTGIEGFIRMDVPFLIDERLDRVNKLRKIIEQSSLTNAEKTRRVFEAFQIENDYGRTIEAYKGKLDVENKTFDVDYLRIGRVAFLYRTVGSEFYGYWDGGKKEWISLNDGLYKRNIDKGIKVARQETAPELLTFPIINPGDSFQ